MMAVWNLLVIALIQCARGVSSTSEEASKPEQIHISYGEKPNHIVIAWLTFDKVKGAVQYGTTSTDKEVVAKQTKFSNHPLVVRYMHRADLKDLEFDTTYVYRVGSKAGWSNQFSFKTPPSGEQWVQRGLMFGDMGVENAKAFPAIKEDVANNPYDIILHVGDIAYDLYEEEGRKGDHFMNMVEPVAAKVPYMTCPGNHEQFWYFTDYKKRFQMPGTSDSMFYSFDLGLVHYVAINTEVYHFSDGKHTTQDHYDWLVKDLEEANKKNNRKKHPWIVMIGHRPMYCTDGGRDGLDRGECAAQATRVGDHHGRYKIEPLLMEYGVDLVVWGHEHVYERLWPVYDNAVYNGSRTEPYRNPRAPVHVITGNAGSRERTDLFLPPAKWTAVQCNDYGYVRFEVHNRTHMYLEQVSVVTKSGEKPADFPKVTDKFWIVQENHRPFTISD